MSLMRPFLSLREDLNRIFNEMEGEFLPHRFRREHKGEAETLCIPPVDVIDQEDEIKVKASVAGIAPENIDIEVNQQTLSLYGKLPEEEKKGSCYQCELPHGRLYRQVVLPSAVQSDKAKADFENGILTVTIPKAEEARRHKIKIGG